MKISLAILQRLTLCVATACLMVTACRPPAKQTFQVPFQLKSLLAAKQRPLIKEKLEFQVRSNSGDPVPWALLSLAWEDGGIIKFQTDQDGALALAFEEDVLEQAITVDVEPRTNVIVQVRW